MVELNDACLAHLKFILLCFEAMSGLKINFAKSEVVVTGVDDLEAMRVAHLLNCKLGSYPFNYLGLPITPDMLHAKDEKSRCQLFSKLRICQTQKRD